MFLILFKYLTPYYCYMFSKPFYSDLLFDSKLVYIFEFWFQRFLLLFIMSSYLNHDPFYQVFFDVTFFYFVNQFQYL